MAMSVYDMDRTITRGGTWGGWLRFWLRREAPWRVLLLPLTGLAGAAYGLGLVGRGDLKAFVHLLVMGRRVARARVEAAAAAYARAVVADGCFEAALAQIAADKASGRRLVLATASNAYYADAIGAALGFDAVVATPSRYVGDWLDWRLGGANNYGAEKARRLSAVIAGPARFYSDHHSDAPVFEMVEERVAVNPTTALRALALKEGWTVLDWGVVEPSLFERG
jgi:phosphoserine phosphatase